MVDTPNNTPHAATFPHDEDPLPARLRAARLAQHLTLAALAQRTGLSVCLIGQLERGEHPLTVALLDTLARGLGVRVQDLLGIEDPDAVLHHLARYMSPPARRAAMALRREMEQWPLSPFDLPYPARLALAARLRQWLAQEG